MERTEARVGAVLTEAVLAAADTPEAPEIIETSAVVVTVVPPIGETDAETKADEAVESEADDVDFLLLLKLVLVFV